MSTILTFIIPVRHQDNAKDWNLLKLNLAQTLRSISSQTVSNWRAVVVANEGADLPIMPDNCEALRVNFPPNQLHDFERGSKSRDAALDAFREDKGRRVLAGMLHAKATRFFMIVDDDDFVSSNLAQFVSKNESANGWKLTEGYIWGDGGRILYIKDDFSNVCGTSLIISRELYSLPEKFEDASIDYIKTMLGSHMQPQRILAERGSALEALPFRGAIYRVGHAGSHSSSPSLLRQFLLSKRYYVSPKLFVRSLLKFRWLTKSILEEYFGSQFSEAND
jgi:hypothetical protein